MNSEDSPAERPALSKPAWLKVRAPGSREYLQTRAVVKQHNLCTVCEEAHCPNIGDCWSHGTATFLIMGEVCTRSCCFCAVKKNPCPPPLDPTEPERIGKAVLELGLHHVVVTSVTRDDLSDFGAQHFADVVGAIHQAAGECRIELLIPDLQGDLKQLKTILDAGIDILNHNLETVPRLYQKIRPAADYGRSLRILRAVKTFSPAVLSKSGIMAGLGESRDEVLRLMDDLRSANVDIFTIGQYLQPSAAHTVVQEYVHPDRFAEFEVEAYQRGFKFVESGVLVRSSYHAWKHSASQPTASSQ